MSRLKLFFINARFFLQWRFVFALLALSGLTACASHHSSRPQESRYEYATFYMETQGEFVVPIGADDPAVYAWSDPSASVKGDIARIWEHLELQGEIEYDFNLIEAALLNHLSARGWKLEDLEISSLPKVHDKFRTAYRYIFRRAVK